MRSYLHFLLFLVLASAYGQEKSKSIKVEYEMQLSFRLYPYYHAILQFDDISSIFSYGSKQINDTSSVDKNGNISIEKADKTIFNILREFDSDSIYEVRSNSGYKGIAEKQQPIKWTIVNDTTKTIGSYSCKFAFANVKGRKYYCWYTESIPISQGPWKLYGLPGLILEAQDDSESVFFTLKKVVYSNKKVKQVSLDKYVFYSKKRYDSLKNKRLTDKLSRIKSKAGRGDVITFKITEREGIEID